MGKVHVFLLGITRVSMVAKMQDVKMQDIVMGQLCALCREADAASLDRYDLVWSVPIKSVDILDPTLPSLYRAPATTTKPSQSN